MLSYAAEEVEEEGNLRLRRGSRTPRGDGRALEAAMAAAPLNKVAGDYLRRAREVRGVIQEVFAAELETELNRGMPPGKPLVGLGQTTLASYELARRRVPAAVVWAAFKLTGLPIRDPEATRAMDDRLRRIEEALGLETQKDKLSVVEPSEGDRPLQ